VKSESIADAVLQVVAERQPGMTGWSAKLPAAERAHLEDLRERWRRHELPMTKRAFARAVVEVCQKRGYFVTGIQGVEHWIGRRSPQ
jgi:hypothetical protein